MRRTSVLVLLSFVTLAAAAFAALRRPIPPRATIDVVQPVAVTTPDPVVIPQTSTGPLTVTAQLDRKWLPSGGSAAYLQLDVAAAGDPASMPKAPVNAVLILDRSGSMAGEKILKAREAARALIEALDGEDRLAIVDFASDARLLLPSTAMSPEARRLALGLVQRLVPTSGTNFSRAFELARPQLIAGRAAGRVDKVFLASDGIVNEGIVARPSLLGLARADFEGATLSTFGVGNDYDEELMEALASQAGGRARFVEDPSVLAPAFKAEFARAAASVAREVKLSVTGLSGVTVEQVFGYELEDGSVRLPDFAAGEKRRILARVRLPGGQGEAQLVEAQVTCVDAAGAHFAANAAAGGTFTADANHLSEAPREVEAAGAKAEMAHIARRAVMAFEAGKRDEAEKMQASIGALSAKVANDLPAEAPALQKDAKSWAQTVDESGTGDLSARKKAKERSFDAARAPVAGW
ncbi:MAG: VWA domain-containing protein [Deltaproteobacteria bacterium]|nr:VWA domain-containing protein [Deltaproteobacteria bacterium]